MGQAGPDFDGRLYEPLFELEAMRRAGWLCPVGTGYAMTAMAFINDGWADRALTLGWTMNELFGVDALAPWARLDRLGAAYLAKNIVAVTDRTMTLNASQGSRLTLRRNQKRAGQAYPWQVIEGQLSSGPLRHPHVRAGGTE